MPEDENAELLAEILNLTVIKTMLQDIHAVKMGMKNLSEAFGRIGKTHRVEALVNLGNYENMRFVSVEAEDWERCYSDLEDGIGRLTSFEAVEFLQNYVERRKKSK